MQRRLHIFQTFGLKSLHLVVLAREGFHHADGRQRLFHDGSQFAFFFAHGAGGLLDLAGQVIHHGEQGGHHRQRDQREPPVHVEHYADHADEREYVDEHSEKRGIDKTLYRFDVICNARNQVAGAIFVMLREREPLNVVV